MDALFIEFKKWVEQRVCHQDMSRAYDPVEWDFQMIIPEWGLHYGDPFSPYLFLFCMKVFSRILINSQDVGHIREIRATQNGPQINHLFFVDDALLFIRIKTKDVEATIKILREFLKASGQQIYLDKSMVLLALTLPGTKGTLWRYLRHLWWACKKKGRGWAMLEWVNFCLPKGMGGIGFRDLRLFNLELLGRQVLSSKYFPNGNIFHPKKVDKPSYAWSSIITTTKALENGFDL
ncbi:reverse transcriptase [Gossypium australe]|uniref:Reverse transcriptase n=1 Tax=Gossypium australe TaxID=47621 RepID=A0A5B6VAG2_9ROSI|nr:reverse transcriptase [Gossypium australe]